MTIIKIDRIAGSQNEEFRIHTDEYDVAVLRTDGQYRLYACGDDEDLEQWYDNHAEALIAAIDSQFPIVLTLAIGE